MSSHLFSECDKGFRTCPASQAPPRPILTDEDGIQYIELDFTIRDLAGNTTDVIVRFVLDPDAPIVPGTGQRELPPRDVPTTLAELIEYYFLTGEADAALAFD